MKKRLLVLLTMALMVLSGCESRQSELYDKGMSALIQEDYVTSIAMFQGAVEAKERLAESYRGLGIACLRDGSYAKAREAFAQSLSSMQHKNADFARDVMLYEAEACIGDGDLDGAIGIYDRMIESEERAELCFARGRARLLQREYDQARTDFDRAVELEKSYRMCLDIYHLYQESSMKADGDRYLEKAAQISPDNTEDYETLGCIYYYLEDDGEAEKALSHAANDGSREAFTLLGSMYLEKGRSEDAKALYQSSLSTEGMEAAANNGLALCALAEGDTEGALSYLEEGLKTAEGKDRENLLFNQIAVYEKKLDFVRATALASAFLEEYPDNEKAQREYTFLQSR